MSLKEANFALRKDRLMGDARKKAFNRSAISAVVAANRQAVGNSVYVNEGRGIFSDDPERVFTKTGAMILGNFNDLAEPVRTFFRKEGRVIKSVNGVESRGARYLVAEDPNLSVPQKLKYFDEDFSDATEALRQLGANIQRHGKETAPVIDYIKNVAITLLNAFVQREKIGI